MAIDKLVAPSPVPRRSGRRKRVGKLARNAELWIVAGILSIAAFLRFWGLVRVGFSGDEAVYAGQAAVLAGDDRMSQYFILASRGNSNFLLFQEIVSVVYRTLGVSDVAARAVSATFSVATVLVLYLLARMLHGERAAVFAAGLLAMSSYAVSLGRLALLDSTATFFVTLAIYFLVRWQRSERVLWLCSFAAATTLAVQAKVTAGLLSAVFIATLALTGSWRRLRFRSIGLAVLAGLATLLPTLVQLTLQADTLANFLGASMRRRSPVPWYYYGQTLVRYERIPVVCVAAFGLVRTALRPSREDTIPWVWFGIFLLFLLGYPLKAFNYLLLLLPALVLLVGRGLATISVPERLRAPLRLPQPSVALGAALAGVGALIATPSLAATLADDRSAGAREAARWLRANAPRNSGVMTLSHGSAQYVYPFYADLPGYPFGRFRLDTVLPGRQIVATRPTRNGRLPLEWVSSYTPRLIENGTVSYFVYATGHLDDPSEENQIVETMTQRDFRSLIESYGGQLVHTVRWHHEVRAYIYRVTKRLQRPSVSFTVGKQSDRPIANVSGAGFQADSSVTLSYHRHVIGNGRADGNGSLTISVPLPAKTQLPYHFTMTDAAGNSGSVSGLPAAIGKHG